LTEDRPTSTTDRFDTIPQLDPTQAADRLAESAPDGARPMLVDVRELHELIAVRAPGSVHVPLSNFALGIRELPRDRPALIICNSGQRSLVAAEFLRRHGQVEVANVSGGIIEWRRRGLPVVSGPLEPGEGKPPSGRGT
jgi:rhodanese-related sulfurtransferase